MIAWLALWLVLSALFVFRFAELLVVDDGPFDIFFRLRTWTGMYDFAPGDGSPYYNANRAQVFLGKILECVHCAGVWLAAPVSAGVAWAFGLNPLEWFVMWLAMAGTQSAIESVAGRK